MFQRLEYTKEARGALQNIAGISGFSVEPYDFVSTKVRSNSKKDRRVSSMNVLRVVRL
jgi:hypothetical protein